MKKKCFVFIICCAVISMLIGCGDKNASAYKEAMKAYEAHNYIDAAEQFESLGDYQDSIQMASSARFYAFSNYILNNGLSISGFSYPSIVKGNESFSTKSFVPSIVVSAISSDDLMVYYYYNHIDEIDYTKPQTLLDAKAVTKVLMLGISKGISNAKYIGSYSVHKLSDTNSKKAEECDGVLLLNDYVLGEKLIKDNLDVELNVMVNDAFDHLIKNLPGLLDSTGTGVTMKDLGFTQL